MGDRPEFNAVPRAEVFAQRSRWFQQPLGQLVAEFEEAVLVGYLQALFGYHLVQVGELRDASVHLNACPVRTKTVFAIDDLFPDRRAGAATENFRLPLATDSIDALVMPHVLEFSANPHQLLREADRVLIPEGRLIACVFNPVSLWGLRRYMPGGRRRSAPWTGQFMAYWRLQDWLTLMGFDIERTEVGMFRPPFASDSMLRRFAFFEPFGKRFWPMLAGVYVVRAVKRVSTLRLVGPRWRRLRPSRAGAMEPTTRGFHRG